MKILENEIWKDIPNYEGFYQASNMGRIKSLERFRKGKNDCLVPLKEKILKPKITRGYYQIVLCKNSTQKKYYIHRLVYETFNGAIPEGYEINHLDERPINNRLSNLNLVTHKENCNFGTRNERCSKKQINGKLSKPVLQFDLNDSFIKEYPSLIQAYRETGFSFQNISKCCNGKQKTAYGYKWKYKENKKGEN